MSPNGYIKLYRSIFGHEFFRPNPFSEREAWVWMLCNAAYMPISRRVGQFYAQIERGELIASVRFLAEKWQWTERSVRTYLARLEKQQMIDTRTDTGITIISIRNYDDYQGVDGQNDTVAAEEVTSGRQGTDKAPTRDRHKREETKKERNEEGEEENEPSPGAGGQLALIEDAGPIADQATKGARGGGRKTRLPADWVLPPEGWAYARSKNFSDQRISVEAEKFKSRHLSLGSMFVRWDQAWRTWVLNAISFDQKRGGGSAGPSISRQAAMDIGFEAQKRGGDF